MQPPPPSYLALLASGELDRRADALLAMLARCTVCPRACEVDRYREATGFCGTGAAAAVSHWCDHHGEEPVLSGTRGSGTIFMGNCNLKCVYCQNHQISQAAQSKEGWAQSHGRLADAMLELQDRGCHNISFVSPSHQVPQIVAAVAIAARHGLRLPLVYNTNAYDSLDTLRLIDGIFDIYLPDLKYGGETEARKYSQGKNYTTASYAAAREMFRQVGLLQLGPDGLARRGLIIRHLVLPNEIAGTTGVLRFIAQELSPQVHISLMSQYFPAHKAPRVPLLSRRLRPREYAEACRTLEDLGLENGWIQGLDAWDHYQPDFDRPVHAFEPDRVAPAPL